MRTIIILAGGLALLGLCLVLARSYAKAGPNMGVKVFIPLWLVASAINLGLGVRAGYSIAEEFPIFVLIFGIPAGIAFLVLQMWNRG